MSTRRLTVDASGLAEGQMRAVSVAGEAVLLSRVNGQFYAVSAVCTHWHCRLNWGILEGNVVTCRCHGSQFDVTTGQNVRGPAKKPLKVYPVAVSGDTVVIDAGQ